MKKPDIKWFTILTICCVFSWTVASGQIVASETASGSAVAIFPACMTPLSGVSGTFAPSMPVTIGSGLTNFATVSADLYRGAQPTAEGFVMLKKLGIKTVVNLRAFHDDAKLMEGSGLAYFHITFEPWAPNMDEVIQFLKIVSDPKNRPVFVHCQHGADRTGTMVAIYRMVMQDWTFKQALDELPNFGFHRIWSNLKTFISSLDIRTIKDRVQQR
ncbi:MAG: dual specificity protein phosphatase family protein [Candidatus Riflebacteria bacterium]|nr:dual specificity protein phosphatase family protein [Candidatus Riflebacteria bacterium]